MTFLFPEWPQLVGGKNQANSCTGACRNISNRRWNTHHLLLLVWSLTDGRSCTFEFVQRPQCPPVGYTATMRAATVSGSVCIIWSVQQFEGQEAQIFSHVVCFTSISYKCGTLGSRSHADNFNFLFNRPWWDSLIVRNKKRTIIRSYYQQKVIIYIIFTNLHWSNYSVLHSTGWGRYKNRTF